MYNIYSKKPTTQGYDSQNVVQIIEGECKNTESKCNFCDGKIYWNPCVIHRNTRKRLPLSQPFAGRGNTPVAHRGCIYNIDNFFKSLVILESDSPYVKATKRNQQDKLFGVEDGKPLSERLINSRTTEEIQRYNEFIKHSTDQTFNSSQKSGINPTKMLNSIRSKK